MELVRLVTTKRSRWSDILHVVLNIGYAFLLFVLVSPGVDLPLIALLLVVLSKWRVIAVRPRFWFANLQANSVDFMVGVSTWALMVLTAPHSGWVAAMLALLYAGWLVVIKPHSTQRWVLLQAALGQFMALTAMFSFAHLFEYGQILRDSSLLTVILAWTIGYMSTRHALSAFHGEDERTFLSLGWGMVTAELAWLLHHWTIAHPLYTVEGVPDGKLLMLPQAAIVITLLSFAAIKVYETLHRPDDKRAAKDTKRALIFVFSALLILFLYNIRADLTAL